MQIIVLFQSFVLGDKSVINRAEGNKLTTFMAFDRRTLAMYSDKHIRYNMIIVMHFYLKINTS